MCGSLETMTFTQEDWCFQGRSTCSNKLWSELWSPPVAGWLKANSDAATCKETKTLLWGTEIEL